MNITQKEYKLVRCGIAPHIQAQSNAPTLLAQSSLTNKTIARNFEAISNPAEPNINISKPQLSDKTIPQNSLNQIEAKEQSDNLRDMDSSESNRTIFKLHKKA